MIKYIPTYKLKLSIKNSIKKIYLVINTLKIYHKLNTFEVFSNSLLVTVVTYQLRKKLYKSDSIGGKISEILLTHFLNLQVQNKKMSQWC